MLMAMRRLDAAEAGGSSQGARQLPVARRGSGPWAAAGL